MTTEEPKASKSLWPQFTLRTTLLFFVFIAAILAAYRFGYQEGRRDGPVIPSTFGSHLIYPREYDVTDLVVTDRSVEPSNLPELIENVKTWVVPSTWDFVGGYATISPGKRQTSLVVEQTVSGHAEIVEHLTDIRDQKESTDPPQNPLTKVLHEVSEMKRKASKNVH